MGTKTKKNPKDVYSADAEDAEATGVFLARNSVEGIRAPDGDEDPMMVLAVKHAFDPSVFKTNPPYFWRAHISNNMVDAYYTRMHATSLQNYAADAEAGVAFQNSHNHRQLGVGRSISGKYTRGGGANPARTEADFYTIPGIRLTPDMSTDDFIMGIRSGLIHDVSIGFFGGVYRCSICSRDMMRDWDCMHIPGFRYDKEGKRIPASSDEEGEVAIAWIHDARLTEVSCVYDGATPGAAILKAQREAAAGRIKPDVQRMVEIRYRIHLPTYDPALFRTDWTRGQELANNEGDVTTDRRDSPDAEETPPPPDGEDAEEQADDEVAAEEKAEEESENTSTGEDTDPGEVTAPDADADEVEADERSGQSDDTRGVPGAMSTDKNKAGTTDDRMIPASEAVAITDLRSVLKLVERDSAEDVVVAVREVVEEVIRLRPIAEDGKTYRAALVTEALEEGVRAHGADFESDTYKGIMEGLQIPSIIRFRDDWRKVADANGLTPGRKTRDAAGEEDKDKKETRATATPNSLHRA